MALLAAAEEEEVVEEEPAGALVDAGGWERLGGMLTDVGGGGGDGWVGAECVVEGNKCGVEVIERSDLLFGRSFNYCIGARLVWGLCDSTSLVCDAVIVKIRWLSLFWLV